MDDTRRCEMTSNLSLDDLRLEDVYKELTDHFLKTGRGRRPAAPDVDDAPTHKLLLLLHCMKEDCDASWDTVLSWFHKLFPDVSDISRGRLEHRIKSTLKASETGTWGTEFLGERVNFSALPEPLEQLGFTRQGLLNDDFSCSLSLNSDCLTNEILSALESFRSKEGLSQAFVCKCLSSHYPNFSERQIRGKATTALKKIKTLKSNKKVEDLKSFLSEPFIIPSLVNQSQIENKSNGSGDNSSSSNSSATVSACDNCKSLKKQNSILEARVTQKSLEVDVLKEERDDLRRESNQLTEATALAKAKTSEVKMLGRQLEERKEELQKLKQSRMYRKNTILKRQIKEARQQLSLLQAEKDETSQELCNLKSKLKNAQTDQSNLRKKLKQEKEKTDCLMEELNTADEDDTLRCDKGNKFRDSVRLAYMELQGKANVAASKCSEVVQIVSKYVCGKEYSLEDLPSTSSALNFADEAHHIAMYQVVDEIKESGHYTYASDGTSRQKKQYLERHIVLDDKTVLSLGFSEIATDDANTLLEQTIEMLDELSTIYCTDDQAKDRDEIFKELVKKMTCLMSDRAAVNKLFNKKMSEYRKNYLGDEDTTTHFLYCNAHFLLGLARATEEAVKETEAEIKAEEGCQLGRDSQAKFGRFSTCAETAACRLIRTTAECLGPRGDEQSGSRQQWLAYCHSKNIVSRLTSFRSNRFNNLFENAAAVIYHSEHITDFLNNSCTHENLKLKSVLADIGDERVLATVGAIALFNLVITEPYWRLMNSSLPYGAFPQYAKKLDSTFTDLDSNGVPQICNVVSVFDDYAVEDPDTKRFLFETSCRRDIWTSTFKKIVEKSHTVLRRQLSDFLSGGVFGEEIDQDTQKVLDTCPLTNLVGERLFGDLDYDMLKRRNATTHHRSSVTMWKHNRTMKWLAKQRSKTRTHIMRAALKNGSKLRMKHRDSSRKVREEIKMKMIENEKKKSEKYVKDAQLRATILENIIAHGGVCKTKEQLEELYQNGKAEALKDQLRYHKIFLNQKHLRVSGTVKTLYQRLLSQIELLSDKDESGEPPLKRKRTESDYGSVTHAMTESESDG